MMGCDPLTLVDDPDDFFTVKGLIQYKYRQVQVHVQEQVQVQVQVQVSPSWKVTLENELILFQFSKEMFKLNCDPKQIPRSKPPQIRKRIN